jgi:hypothetical protein
MVSWGKGDTQAERRATSCSRRKEPNIFPARSPGYLFLGTRPYRRLWDFLFISFQHRFMADGSRGPLAPIDPFSNFGLRQGSPAPSQGGAGAVIAALTWTETQTSCDPFSVPCSVLCQAKGGTRVNKGREKSWLQGSEILLCVGAFREWGTERFHGPIIVRPSLSIGWSHRNTDCYYSY